MSSKFQNSYTPFYLNTMKNLKILIISATSLFITSCEEKTSRYSYDDETTERITCPVCNGTGCPLCYQSGDGTVWRPVEEHITETRKGSDVVFRGKTTTVYGRCNSGCGCRAYVPVSSGNSACASCSYYGCSTNKFGHEH